jgi:hypothetical protein
MRCHLLAVVFCVGVCACAAPRMGCKGQLQPINAPAAQHHPISGNSQPPDGVQ